MSCANEQAEDVFRRLRHGDEATLASLFLEHRERLWRTVHFRMDHRLAGRIDADDVLQEAYLAAAQRLGHCALDRPMSPFIWLRMVVLQTLTDMHRHHLAVKMRDASREVAVAGCRYPQATTVSLVAQLAGHLTSPSQAAARAEMLGQVEQAVARMDPLDREILALRHFEELSNSEVAEVLGIQPKAASIRYVRALRRLRTALSNRPGFFEDHDGV